MAINSSSFTITFDHANDQISMVDTTDYSGTGSQTVVAANATGVMTITDPNGNQYIINIVASTSLNGSALVTILDNGQFIKGNWSFSYVVTDSTDASTATSTAAINYQYSTLSANLAMTYDVAIPQLDSNDTASYTYNGVVATQSNITHNLYYPGTTPGTTITETDNSITTNVVYAQTGETLQYSSDISIDLSFAVDSIFTITDTVVDQGFINITDSLSLCEIYCCIRAKWQAYENARCKNSSLVDTLKEELIEMVANMKLIEQAIKCGKTENINDYKARILEIGNCSDECGCSDGEPTLVTGLGGAATGSGNTTIVNNTDSSITVTASVAGSITTYTVSLSAALQAAIAANTANIATNTTNIATNTGNISTNTTNITGNTTNITTNTANIATNTTNIATNTAAIAGLTAPDRLNFQIIMSVGKTAYSAAVSDPISAPIPGPSIENIKTTGTFFDGTPSVATNAVNPLFWNGTFRLKMSVNASGALTANNFKVSVQKRQGNFRGTSDMTDPNIRPEAALSIANQLSFMEWDVQCDNTTAPNVLYLTPRIEVLSTYQTVTALTFFGQYETFILDVIIEH